MGRASRHRGDSTSSPLTSHANRITTSLMNTAPARKLWRMLRSSVPLALAFPGLIWIFLDKSVWTWDPALYGRHAVELSDALIDSPSRWVWQMMTSPSMAAPGASWFGQFLVPLGRAVGSIDSALLLSIWITQAVTLLLIHRCLLQLSAKNQAVAFTGCAVTASAPLFVGVSHYFLAEPQQLVAVAWFVLIMSCAPRWPPALTLGQLLAAAPFALLAKASSPLYCLGPGVVALWYVVKGPRPLFVGHDWRKPSIVVTLAIAILLNAAAAVWYGNNISRVMQHAALASSGPVAELYGQRDSFTGALTFWLQAVQRSLFIQPAALVGALFFCLAVLRHYYGHSQSTRHFTKCCVFSTVQMLIVLAAFSLSANRDVRFLMPLLPYLSVMMAWSVARLNMRLLTAVAAFMFVAQLTIVHGQSFGFMSPNLQLPYVSVLNRDREQAAVVESIVERTCSDAPPEHSAGRYWNVVGESRSWLNVNTLGYTAAKKRVLNKRLSCSYAQVGGYFMADADAEWERILSLAPHYYIATDPDVYPMPNDKVTQAMHQLYIPLRERVEISGLFERQAGLGEDPGVTIFRRVQPRKDALAVAEMSLPAARRVRFGDRFELSGAVLTPNAEGLVLKLAWRCLRATVLDYFVAVHLVDQNGTILAQSDLAQDPFAGFVMPGDEWVDRVFLSRRKLAGASHVAIALYKPAARVELELIDRGPRDWNGHRLLLSLDGVRGGK